MSRSPPVPSSNFYATFHGHNVHFLAAIHRALKSKHRGCIYLAGDSSLDNKYWLHGVRDAVNGYETVLQPPTMKPDVCYWLNYYLAQQSSASLFALNTSVEATTLGQRDQGWFSSGLQEQDLFIRDNITEEDYLIVSVGGNDVALAPSFCTIVSILALVHGASDDAIRGGTALGLGQLLHMFGDKLAEYIRRLVERRKPRKVLVCMIYFPDVGGTGSWADTALSALSYNSDPRRLQSAIVSVFEQAVCKIHIPGTQVVPVPLFRVLDCQDSGDYVARVEPSVEGGRKMAQAFLQYLFAPRLGPVPGLEPAPCTPSCF